jgi:hypothetical protein
MTKAGRERMASSEETPSQEMPMVREAVVAPLGPWRDGAGRGAGLRPRPQDVAQLATARAVSRATSGERTGRRAVGALRDVARGLRA